jgi:hypothetical protein
LARADREGRSVARVTKTLTHYDSIVRPPSQIMPSFTVRQAATAWPACAQVLGEFENARWDGRSSLQELAAFARSGRFDEETLLQRLSAAAGVPLAERETTSHRDRSPIALIFLALAVSLTLGASWGVILLLRIAQGADYGAVSGASVHVHGVAQLWGWMTLFIFAVATHLLRQTTARPAPAWLERLAASFVVAALLGSFVGLSDSVLNLAPAIDIVSSCVLLAAAILFGISVIWSLSGTAKTQRRHGLVFLVGWLWAWAATDLWLRLHYASAAALPDSARELLIVLPVLGLGTNAIYGFGIRLIPGLLNIGRLRPRYFSLALILHNVGLCLFLNPRRIVSTTGAALMFAGSIAYLVGMRGLRSEPSRPIYGVDPRTHALIRIAFFWLVCGVAMILVNELFPRLPHAFSGAWRHALTVGFITTMILGVGQRIVPIFIKQPLASTRMMLVSGVFIVVGNAGRVGLELGTISGRPWTFRLMGITGVLELTALLLFAINLALTVRTRRRVYRATDPLTPAVRVREAINARPELQQRLCASGITMFDQAPFIAPSMTFGALALASGRQPHDLLAELNRAPAELPT